MFLFFKTQHKRGITLFLKTSKVRFFFKVLITNAGPCRYFKAISEKHLRCSLFFKRIIWKHNFTFCAWSDYSTYLRDIQCIKSVLAFGQLADCQRQAITTVFERKVRTKDTSRIGYPYDSLMLMQK